MSAYIFILCPPFSGSTLLWRLVATSGAVSALPREGQFISEVKGIMRRDPWNAEAKLPWKEIKAVWDGYWDLAKPLLVEKSPPNLLRAGDIAAHFSPVYFLLMVRNPYAHCEGMIRRGLGTATEAAEFAVYCMRRQADNAERLSNVLSFSYEDLVAHPASVSERIQTFIPDIGPLQHGQRFTLPSIDGVVTRGIEDLNEKKISNLSASERIDITRVLRNNADVLRYWGYEYV